MARYCPECGGSINATACPCGWRDKTKRREEPEIDRKRCHCGRPGTLSHSVTGGGKWYCREHFQW